MTTNINEILQNQIAANDIVIYAKGSKDVPMCGFSNAVIQIFKNLDVDFTVHNVLADGEIWQGIKSYNNWPTIPQIFVKQEFVGGCDIVREMYETGELQQLLQDKGLIAA